MRSLKNMAAALICLAILLFTGPSCAAASPTETSLWVDCSDIPTDAGRLAPLAVKMGAHRLFVPLLIQGRTTLPGLSPLFPPFAHCAAAPSAVAELVKSAHKQHVQVYGYVDCLHWDGSDDPAGPLHRHPDLVELSTAGSCGEPRGDYAAPFDRRVEEGLLGLLTQASRRLPELDGILLQCRMPVGSLLGYSDSSRLAYIRDVGMDPADLILGSSPEAIEDSMPWVTWRIQHLSSLVTRLATACHADWPRSQVAVVAHAAWYRLRPGLKNRSLEDWVSWAKTGLINEVLFDGRWEQHDEAPTYPEALWRLSRVPHPPGGSFVLDFRDGADRVDPLDELAQEEGAPIRRLVMRVKQVADLELANRFASDILPQIEPALLGTVAAAEPASQELDSLPPAPGVVMKATGAPAPATSRRTGP